MLRITPLILLLVAGCRGAAAPEPATPGGDRFAPVSARLHPIFTRPDDFNGDGVIDGVRALLELQDRFGDPTKDSGEAYFELFGYDPTSPDQRGPRIGGPWRGSLVTLDLQDKHYNPQLRAYEFDLPADARLRRSLAAGDRMRLGVVYQVPGGPRLFDDRILAAPRSAD